MNALTSKLWFYFTATWHSNHFRHIEIKEQSACQQSTETSHASSPRSEKLNSKLGEILSFPLSCVHLAIQISQKQFGIAMSSCNLLSCENTLASCWAGCKMNSVTRPWCKKTHQKTMTKVMILKIVWTLSYNLISIIGSTSFRWVAVINYRGVNKILYSNYQSPTIKTAHFNGRRWIFQISSSLKFRLYFLSHLLSVTTGRGLCYSSYNY